MNADEPKKRILEKEAVLHCHRDKKMKFTLAAIFNDNRKEYDIGISIFNNNDKLFKKKIGKLIALGRASRRPIMHIPLESAEKVESIVDILKVLETDLRKDHLRMVFNSLKTVID